MASNPEQRLSSLQYLGVVGRLARDNPTHVWWHYDKQFRQMATAVPTSAQWGELNFQFLQWAKQKDPNPLNHGRPVGNGTRVGFASSPHASETIPAPPVASRIGEWPVLPHRYHTSPLGAPGCPILDRHRPLQPHTVAVESQNHTNLRT